MSGNNFNFDYDLPDFQFDPAEIPDNQLELVETEIANREEIIGDLRKQVIEEESHRKQLQSTVERLQSETVDLQEKVRRLQSERSTTRPRDVFANFSRAVEEVETDLADSRYRLADFQVEMKANVLHDQDGVKFHLPGADEDFAAGNLSTVNFRVTDREEPEAPDATYDPIPDLVGMAVERARAVVQREGFTVGTVEPEPTAETGVVVDQFPSPRSVAEPGTAIDLTVSWEEQTTDESDADEGDTNSSEPTDDRSRLDRERLESRLPSIEEIDGIGPTYADRLRSAGIESILDLARSDPATASEAAHTSSSRAEGWIEEARMIITDISR